MAKCGMSFDEIMDTIRNLAMSQGSYGRMLNSINEMAVNSPDAFEEFKDTIESMEFGSAVDFVMWVEG